MTRVHKLIVLTAGLSCLALAACAGKKDVSPVDKERQAFEDLRSEIRDAVDDPAREARALSLVDELVGDLDTLRATITERRTRFRQLNANYDTPRAEFDAYVEQIRRELQSNRSAATNAHRRFVAVLTPDELKQIAKAQSRAMKDAIRALQST